MFMGALERELSFGLFEPLGNRVRLTPAAAGQLAAAGEILRKLESMAETTKTLRPDKKN
jgi:DNA-binding transcriptional LysR family regulator